MRCLVSSLDQLAVLVTHWEILKLESLGLNRAPAGNFPWRTLPTKLADGKLTLHGWPRRCRHPGNEEQGNKGISSLHLHERRILAKAFGDDIHPLTLRNMEEPDSYLKST